MENNQNIENYQLPNESEIPPPPSPPPVEKPVTVTDVESAAKKSPEKGEGKGLLKIWVVWYVIAIVMSIVQSCIFIGDYLKFEVTEETLFEDQPRFELPAITVCSGATIAPEKARMQFDKIETFNDLMSEMSLISNSERYLLGPDVSQYVAKCSFNEDHIFSGKGCWDPTANSSYNKLVATFNNLYFGNCATFNTNRYQQRLTESQSVLPTEINLAINTQYLESEPIWNKGPVVIFHEPETEPIFDAKNINYVDKTSDAIILVTKRDFRRIPWPYTSQCVTREEVNVRTTQKGERQHYLYSIEACITRCLQNLTITYCKCRLPEFHSNKTLPSCIGCKTIPPRELEEMCNCKHACRYSEYDLTIKQIRNKLSDGESKSLLKGETIGQRNKTRINTTNNTKLKNRDLVNVKILVANTNVKTIRELLYYHVAYMLSDIGGIFGLWIGISIMTIFEFLYEILNMCRKCLRRCCVSSRSSTSENINDENDASANRLVESSIPMVQRIQYSTNCFAKVCWACLFIIGIFFATGQVYRLSKLYHEFRVLESVSDKVQMEVFPAVTVCSNVPVMSWDRLAAKSRDAISINATSLELYNFLAHKSDSFRTAVGVPLKKFIKQCQYEVSGRKYSCKNLLETNIPKFGNCVTFNAGLLNSDQSDELPSELIMRLQYIDSFFSEKSESYNKGLYVHLHPMGTSPFMHPKEWIFIRPGEFFVITFETTVTERLPDPYINHCVSEYDPEHQWKNLFHNHDTQYLHTYKGCTESCQFNMTLITKDCMNLVNAEFKGRIELDDETMVREYYSTCTAIPQNLSDTLCRCQLPCRSMEIKPNIRKISKTMFTSTQETGLDFDENEPDPYNKANLSSSGFILMAESPYVTLISEEPHLYLADLCCAIGGTLGMWVGISILSVIELKVFIFLKLIGKTD